VLTVPGDLLVFGDLLVIEEQEREPGSREHESRGEPAVAATRYERGIEGRRQT
jgi:hypothetical protein